MLLGIGFMLNPHIVTGKYIYPLFVRKLMPKHGIAKHFREGNISLILDDYDDIFSDFDPRHFSERALSDDFLYECKKAVRERAEDGLGAELRLLIPKKRRNVGSEQVIKKRLMNYFHKQMHERLKERKEARRWGFVWTMVGAVLIYVATLLYAYENAFSNFLIVLLEPAGWFTIWMAFDMLFYGQKERRVEFNFAKSMANMKLVFKGY